jgi:DNA-binding transcriptional ArsR family regulator
MESVFEVIAEPNRRAILSLLGSAEQSVGEIERQLRMPQPTVSKHLRVLRDAGFVESTVDAQRRLYRLRPEPLQEVDMWLAQFRRFWSMLWNGTWTAWINWREQKRPRPVKKQHP